MTFKAPTLLELSDAATAFGALSFAGTLENKALVEHVVALHQPTPKGVALSWWNGKKQIPKAWSSGVLIAHPDHNAMATTSVGWVIFAQRPRLVLGKLIEEFFPGYEPHQYFVGPIVLSDGAATPLAGVSTGQHVSIGCAGQALEWDEESQSWFKIPHLYGIRFGDDVTVGAGSTIQRGLLCDTVIGDDVKIGQGVNIGHGCEIGEHSVIFAHACLGGSVILEENVTVGMGAIIKNGVRIGAHATVGMGAVVLHDVNPGVTVVGNPAKVLL